MNLKVYKHASGTSLWEAKRLRRIWKYLYNHCVILIKVCWIQVSMHFRCEYNMFTWCFKNKMTLQSMEMRMNIFLIFNTANCADWRSFICEKAKKTLKFLLGVMQRQEVKTKGVWVMLQVFTFVNRIITTLKRIRTTPQEDNSPPYRFWSWRVVLFRGSGPSGELSWSWWGIVLGIVVLVGNGWALFLSGGELSSWGVVLEPPWRDTWTTQNGY